MKLDADPARIGVVRCVQEDKGRNRNDEHTLAYS